MKTRWVGRWLVAMALLFAGCGGPVTAARSGTETAIQLLEVGIGEARPDVIRPLIGDDYRQHNPRVPDGPSGLLGFVTEFSRRPPSERVGVRVLRSLEEGDLVATHSEYLRQGRRIAGFDLFRMRDGQLVEHWDVGMRERGQNPSGHGLLDGSRPDALSLAPLDSQTGRHVRRLVEAGLVRRDARVLQERVSPTCIQHDPRFGDGRAAWAEAVVEGELVHVELVRTLAQGRWALTQSRGRWRDQPAVINDLFRLEGDLVVEHWVVWERIPARMAHPNGML